MNRKDNNQVSWWTLKEWRFLYWFKYLVIIIIIVRGGRAKNQGYELGEGQIIPRSNNRCSEKWQTRDETQSWGGTKIKRWIDGKKGKLSFNSIIV